MKRYRIHGAWESSADVEIDDDFGVWDIPDELPWPDEVHEIDSDGKTLRVGQVEYDYVAYDSYVPIGIEWQQK